VPLEFRALIEDPTSAEDYRALNCPALVLCGEHAPTPSRLIAEALPELLPVSRLTVVAGAGHMGPLTHAAEVSRLIAERIVTARQDSDPSHAPPLRRAQPMGA
jgi:pimeloyl-ACP methyl ester carboxylesterase